MQVNDAATAPGLIKAPRKQTSNKTKSSKVAEEAIYIFKPTEGESWTSVKVNFGFTQRALYTTVIYPALALFVKPKLAHKPEAWDLIHAIELGSIKTVGDIDVLTAKILQETMCASEERCIEVHDKLKAGLKVFAEDGFLKAKDVFLELIRNA